jgi:hypothetical protein
MAVPLGPGPASPYETYDLSSHDGDVVVRRLRLFVEPQECRDLLLAGIPHPLPVRLRIGAQIVVKPLIAHPESTA